MLSKMTSQLKSLGKERLSAWFVNSYIQKCSMLCSCTVSSLFSDVSTNRKLQNAVDCRLNIALESMWHELTPAEWLITDGVSRDSLTEWSCVCWMTELPKTYAPLTVYFTAVAFLHVAYKISRTGFTDDLMDVLATIVGQFSSTRRHRSQCSSELSLSQQPTLSATAVSYTHLTLPTTPYV